MLGGQMAGGLVMVDWLKQLIKFPTQSQYQGQSAKQLLLLMPLVALWYLQGGLVKRQMQVRRLVR